jgi:hypothetical protein
MTSQAELTLNVQMEQAGIPFEREFRFAPPRRWRVLEYVYGEGWAAPTANLRTVRAGLSSMAVGSTVLLQAMYPAGLAREASGDIGLSAMRHRIHQAIREPDLLFAALSLRSRLATQGRTPYRRSWQGMGEGRPSRTTESELEGRRYPVRIIPQASRSEARQTSSLLPMRHHRSAMDLRLGEPNRQLCGHRRLRSYVSALPSAVRQ